MLNKHNFNIKIENFGPIKEVDLDICPLTVFMGPNNSGKSFAAKLIHCLSLNTEEDISEIGLKYVFDSLKENNKTQVFDFINEIRNYIKTNPTINSEPLKIPIEKIDLVINEGIIVYFSEIITDMIKSQFEEELNDLINFNKDFFKINIGNCELIKKINDDLILDVGKTVLNSDESPKSNGKLLMRVRSDNENLIFNIESMLLDKNNLEDFSIFLLFYQTIGLNIFREVLLENSFYIPSERSELVIDKKLLTRKIQNKSDISKNQSEVLANILNIDSAKKGIFYDIACDLEREFSNIIVDVDDTSVFNSVIYKNSDTREEISSKLVSTSIHELSILILYLKYVLKKGDLLIIEEPEVHLHPADQLILVKYFAKAINKGLKILITTHSDYIIEKFNNLIRLGNCKSEVFAELDYDEECVLNYEDVAIHNFKKNDNYSYKSNIVDVNFTGFSDENFSQVIDELYDESDIIGKYKLR